MKKLLPILGCLVAAVSLLLLAPAVGERLAARDPAPADQGEAPDLSGHLTQSLNESSGTGGAAGADDRPDDDTDHDSAVPPEGGAADPDGGDSAEKDGDPAGSGEDSPAPSPYPDLMESLLSESGFEAEDIAGAQLVIVKSSGNTARICAFERDGDGAWTVFLEECSGHVGKNGVSAAKTEGDGRTPMGIFTLPGAFGNEPDPGCLLPYRQATPNSYWVDDPDSESYNTWVEDDGNRDWISAEHISDYSAAYAYAAVIGYNVDPITPGAGSAIFLHVGSGPTSGCVSMSRENVIKVLKWLDPEKDPHILIF